LPKLDHIFWQIQLGKIAHCVVGDPSQFLLNFDWTLYLLGFNNDLRFDIFYRVNHVAPPIKFDSSAYSTILKGTDSAHNADYFDKTANLFDPAWQDSGTQ
jgi:hypothetical protein